MNSPLLRQSWAVSAVVMNMIGLGATLSHTTCLMAALKDPHSTLRADLKTASLLASSSGLAGVPGFLLSSVLMNIYGRRLAHMLMVTPAIIGALALYFAQDIPTLMLGRICGGAATGATVLLGAIVIGEYTDPKYRGVFLNLKTVAFGFGGMTVHALSHILSWRTIAILTIFPHIASVIITYTWPESPPWLASKGNIEESKKSFIWLRGQTKSSQRELEKLIKSQMEILTKLQLKQSISSRFATFFMKFTRKDFLKPIFIVFISVVLLESSGRHFFPAFALQIIGDIAGSKSESFYYTISLDIIITTSALCSSILVKVLRRRVLLFYSGFASFVVLMCTCTYLTLAANEIVPNDKSWLTIGFFVAYFILANLGCTPIPLALLGEVLPLPHRGVGSVLAGIWMALSLMIVLQITPHLLANITVHGTFFVYGITTGVALLILYFVLPETKDKTLQEIEDYFNHGEFRDDEKDEEVTINMIKDQNYK